MTKQAKLVCIAAILLLAASLVCWILFGGDAPIGNESSSESGRQSQTTSDTSEVSESPAVKTDEVRAMWISMLDYAQYTTGKDEAGFREAFASIVDDCAALGLNTLFVHVRPYGDAMYPSAYFPWSSYASGTQGVDPGYDPLAVMLELAHAKGMQVHAWLNPLRICRDEAMQQTLAEDNIGLLWWNEQNGRVCIADGGLYYNPASDAVHTLVLNGIAEILEHYDVDGIHFDDYFYPTTDEEFDDLDYAAYQRDGGTMSLADWRRDNVNRLVRAVHTLCAEKGRVFGISPAGNIENNFQSLYADVERWCSQDGYVDYICPQIYFGFDHATRPFVETMEDWAAFCREDVALYIGLAAYKVGLSDTWAGDGAEEWVENTDLLARQIEALRANEKASGFALFRYGSMLDPTQDVAENMQQELTALRALLGK